MATPSEETKSTVSKMAMSGAKLAFTGVKKSFSAVKKLITKTPTSEFVADEKETPVEVLGKIYKMMKIMDEDKKLNHEMANSFLEEEELEKNKRNQEIIKALTGRKTKKEIRQVYRDEKGRFKKEPGKEQPTTPTKGGEPVTSTAKPSTPVQPPAKPSTPVQPPAKPSQPTKIPEKPSQPAKTVESPKKPNTAIKKPATKPNKKITNEPVATAKPVTTAPTPPAPTPPVATPTSIIPKVAAVGAVAGATSVGIGAAESGGKYNITFGDSIDKNGKVIRGKNLSPEKRFNGRDLTDLTLEEIDMLGKERNKVSPSTSAMGKYQFMNSTLFGSKGKPGLVQQKGYDMKTTKFTPDIQEELYKKLHEQDIATLKRLGVPITPGYEYMAHYIGAGGAKAIYVRRNTDMTVQQALIDAKLPDPVHGKTNEELKKIKASNFENVLAERVKKGTNVPHSSNKTGSSLKSSSEENAQMKKELNAQSQTTRNNTIVINNIPSGASPNVEKEDDRSPMNKKAKQ